MTETHEIAAWLVVDWRSGSTRTRKSKPANQELGTNELLAELAIEVAVPEVDVPTLAARIEVPEPRVQAATLEALDEEELPDWTDTAAEVVEEHCDRVADPGPDEWTVEQLSFRVLERDPGRPDPELVSEFVQDLLESVAEREEVAADGGDRQ